MSFYSLLSLKEVGGIKQKVIDQMFGGGTLVYQMGIVS